MHSSVISSVYHLCILNGLIAHILWDVFFFSFPKENLTLAIGLPANMGAAGVVIWGSSSFLHTPNECLLLQKYISTVLGPYVKNLTDFFTSCSSKLCSGHGRCIRRDLEAIVQFHLKASGREHCQLRESPVQLKENEDWSKRRSSSSPYDDYVCRCLKGWMGEHCEKSL